MQFPLRHITHLMNRRSRSGQSIILIAFAFIALIAFVGIATDVAMLFVRFSTLRRAVDAAAIASAGQIREKANYLTLNSTAKQFIQIHGIDPKKVMVETCDTEVLDYLALPVNAGKTALQALDDLTAQSPGTAPLSELCRKNPQKLIRVTAQVDSPTAFLSILGWGVVTLQTSSVAQTAVLDVAIVLDTSLSEMQDTFTHQKAETSPGVLQYPCTYVGTTNPGPCGGDDSGFADNSESLKDFKDFTNKPPYWDVGTSATVGSPSATDGVALDPYDNTHTNPMAIRDECWISLRAPENTAASNYAWAGCCNDPATQTDDIDRSKAVGATDYWVTGYYQNHDATGGFGTKDPHAVMLSDDPADPNYNNPGNNATLHGVGLPGQGRVTGYNPDPNWYLYDDETIPASVIIWNGYQPYSGKPAAKVISGNPDGNKSDLICRPFKDVRDAARRFIRRLDFLRGDRVVLVTFDSGGRAIQPYGAAVPILTDKNTAVRTLNMQVGVEVNPVPSQLGSNCVSRDSYEGQYVLDKVFPELPPIPPSTTSSGSYTPRDFYVDVNRGRVINADDPTTNSGTLRKGYNLASYWTVVQCPDTNTGGGIQAANNALVNPNWIRRESVWVMIVLSDGYPNRTPAIGNAGIMSATRDWLQVENVDVPHDYTMPPSMDPGALSQDEIDRIDKYCNLYLTPTPVGLLPTPTPVPAGQPTPSLPINVDNYGKQPQWCITDAQSDPAAQPYRYPDYPWGLRPDNGGTAAGSFGFCPWWTFCDLHPEPDPDPDVQANSPVDGYDRLTQCTENNAGGIWSPSTKKPNKPYCTDADPNARHSCMDGTGRINPGTGDNPNPTDYYCDQHYDATDYARDRADFAGLINYMDKSSDGKAKKGNFIAIYSIFFDHVSSTGKIGENILGVKFLRYLSDVGDNGQVDNHLQRWYRDTRDGVYGGDAWKNPPTGLSDAAAKLPNGTISNDGKTLCPTLTGNCDNQPTPMTYDGTDVRWSDGSQAFKYPLSQDACHGLDYAELGNPAPGSGAYESAAKADCGQFFYANDPSKVTAAFIEIAGRLFTRLSR